MGLTRRATIRLSQRHRLAMMTNEQVKAQLLAKPAKKNDED